jgi:serine/threonine-protein kinase
MLWEALTGEKHRKAHTDATNNKPKQTPPNPPPRNEQLPIAPELLEICQRALAPDREQRYQTALDFELQLEEYLATRSHYASARELGKFMSERFAETRSAIEQRIENELGHGESSRPPAGSLLPRSATPSRTGYTASRSAPDEPPRSRLWIYAVAFVALGLAILAWGVREKPGRASNDSPAPSAAQSPRSVTISIEARPTTASIWLDDVPLPNPYSAEHARDGELHRVRVAAPGYVTEDTEVRFDADVRMFRSLLPERAPEISSGSVVSTAALPPHAHPTAPAANAPSARASTPAPPASCDPPYYLDARGIKKFKPECL